MRRRGPVVKMTEEKKWDVHPIWRGIGALMVIIIPLISYTVSTIIVDAYPDVFLQLAEELKTPVDLGALGVVHFFWAKIGLTFLITLFLFTIVFIFYSIVYAAAAGNMRYGPTDVTAKEYRDSLKEMKQRAKRTK